MLLIYYICCILELAFAETMPKECWVGYNSHCYRKIKTGHGNVTDTFLRYLIREFVKCIAFPLPRCYWSCFAIQIKSKNKHWGQYHNLILLILIKHLSKPAVWLRWMDGWKDKSVISCAQQGEKTGEKGPCMCVYKSIHVDTHMRVLASLTNH